MEYLLRFGDRDWFTFYHRERFKVNQKIFGNLENFLIRLIYLIIVNRVLLVIFEAIIRKC